MRITGKNILLISPEGWDHIFVSKHHYAIHLGRRDNLVFFLNPPGDKEGLKPTSFKNVFEIDYKGFPRGLRFYPGFIREYIMARVCNRLQQLCNVEFDLIWSFDNSVFFDFNIFPASVVKINHIVDLNQDFETKKAASTADYCFSTTEAIRIRLSAYNPNVFKINHGFNESFREVADVSNLFHPGIKVLYAGNLSMPYVDWNLIDAITDQNPQVNFYFIGPGKIPAEGAKRNVIKKSNAFFLGAVQSANLQNYYGLADILLIAYQEKFHVDQANPHKMMEYLGSGKMIVSTYTAEFAESANGIFEMTRHNREFPEAFSSTLRKLDYWNAVGLQNARRAIAMQNTYDKQIDRIGQIIQ